MNTYISVCVSVLHICVKCRLNPVKDDNMKKNLISYTSTDDESSDLKSNWIYNFLDCKDKPRNNIKTPEVYTMIIFSNFLF